MNELESTRQHIQKGGRLLYRLCAAAKIILLVLICLHVVLLGAILLSPKTAVLLGPHLDDSFLFLMLKDAVGADDEIQPVYAAAIGCAVLLVTYIAIYVILRTFSGILKFLAEAERPFDVETARRVRHSAFWLLLFIVYNPVLGLISFALMVLFSYIMEYGGYIQERADETNRIQEEMILSFAEITENKSGQTGQHIKRVSEYSRILAEELGLELGRVEFIRIASTMHDVGKLLIPSEILEKPGKLTPAEYDTIKTHTTMGGQLLQNVEGEEMQLSRTIALEHHERYDGSGYPAQMHGDDISLEGRIVAVADVYDALTSRRSYKEAWTDEDACREILAGRGSQFDPQVVDAFLAAHDRILEVREKFKD